MCTTPDALFLSQQRRENLNWRTLKQLIMTQVDVTAIKNIKNTVINNEALVLIKIPILPALWSHCSRLADQCFMNLLPPAQLKEIHSYCTGHTFALTPRFKGSPQLPAAQETFLGIAFSSQSAFRLWSPVWRMQTRQRFVLVWWTRSTTWATWKPFG